MKYLSLFAILFFPIQALSADYAIDFDLDSIVVEGDTFTSLKLDLDLTGRYISANGIVSMSSGLSVPVTGSCFGTDTGGALCVVQALNYAVALTLDAELNGTIQVRDGIGVEIDTGTIGLSDWQPQ